MASVSTSHLILFIASMLIAASVAGTFINGVERLSGALGDKSLDVSKEVRTDIEIISDSGSSAVYNSSGNENITVLVKNTGSRGLVGEPEELDVLVDGQYQTDIAVTVLDGTTWGVGNVAKIEVNKPLSPGDHRITVIAAGDEEVFRFRT